MTAPTFIELKPDPELLNPNFDGYKLSLRSIPTIKKELMCPVHQARPIGDIKYSYLHSRLISFHNHLFEDQNSVYFFDENLRLIKIDIDAYTHRFTDYAIVHTFPPDSATKDYDFSLKFLENKMAVVSDGNGTLYLFEINEDDNVWTELYSKKFDFGFVLKDLRAGSNGIDILAHHVDNRGTILTHFLLKKTTDWSLEISNEITSKGDVFYGFFDSDCTGLLTISTKGLDQSTIDYQYFWSQTTDNVTLNLKIDSIGKVEVSPDFFLKIFSADSSVVILEGELGGEIDRESIDWIVRVGEVVIDLRKKSECDWCEFLIGDTRGLLRQQTSTKESEGETGGLLYNSQQIEECDFESYDTVFERICFSTNHVTHRSNFGSHSVLFSTGSRDRPGPPTFAVRYDVDACLWRPLPVDGALTLKHVGTLMAFGYIQASKQQKKYVTCSADFNCSVIGESNGRIFLYRQNRPIGDGELRNRSTNRIVRHVAEQQLVSFNGEEILGLCFIGDHLIVLTDKNICLLHL